MTVNAIKIEGSDISCGVNYYHNLTLEGFKIGLKNKKLKRPKYVHWDEPGYDEYLRADEAYCDSIGNNFREGFTYIFSDNDAGEGKLIARFIRKNKLGKILSTGWNRNPNSGNQICTWLWIYNGKKVKANAKRKTASRRVGR